MAPNVLLDRVNYVIPDLVMVFPTINYTLEVQNCFALL